MPTVSAIDIIALKHNGIKAIIFDLDNTLSTWNGTHIEPATLTWLAVLHKSGLKYCILSNNSAERIAPVAERLEMPFIARAYKPFKGGYRRALRLLAVEPTAAVMVGDQLLTDIWGANRIGMHSILLKPISREHEFSGTKANRLLERCCWPAISKNMQEKLAPGSEDKS